MRAYFGFYIFMGLVREPEIRDYWSSDDVFHYSPIAGRISRIRFEEMSWYLHFVNIEELPLCGSPMYHRLQRVKPVIDALHSSANVSVDEAMVPFKCKSAVHIMYIYIHFPLSNTHPITIHVATK